MTALPPAAFRTSSRQMRTRDAGKGSARWIWEAPRDQERATAQNNLGSDRAIPVGSLDFDTLLAYSLSKENLA